MSIATMKKVTKKKLNQGKASKKDGSKQGKKRNKSFKTKIGCFAGALCPEATNAHIKCQCEPSKDDLKTESTVSRLQLAGGFSWESDEPPCLQSSAVPQLDVSDDSGEEDAGVAASGGQRRQSRAERVAAARLEEQRLYQLEQRQLESGCTLETADDFERLTVAQPDDSSCWIRYMSYFLQATEIEKARAVARRALKVINFREEEEKLNVYIAWLNLESLHGTQDSLTNVLHEAVQANDPFQVYTRMAEVHLANGKPEEAEQMYAKLARKMPSRMDVWLRYGVFLMKASRLDAARSLMQRALRCLDKRDHVEVISKFAQLEFRFGEPERGCTMFDKLVASYPRRLDQWLVYVTQLRRGGDVAGARRVFARLSVVPLGVRRVRSVFKQWLEFEQQFGTPEDEANVRQQAQDYVESQSEPN